MTQLEVIKQIIAFFTIPVTGCKVDDEQEHFRNVVEFQLKNYEKEDEKKYLLKHRLEKLELLKQEALKFKNESFPETDPPFYHIAKIDRFAEYCTKVFHLENCPENPTVENQPPPEPKETELSEKIKKHFGFFNGNCPRKHKQILNDTDFEKLIKWTIWYFENEFKVPEISEPIKVVNTNKTFVQLAFKYLFKKLHKSSPYPETLFEFYQSAFAPYSEDKKSNFEAVKNNDEVKKLMQIDY